MSLINGIKERHTKEYFAEIIEKDKIEKYLVRIRL